MPHIEARTAQRVSEFLQSVLSAADPRASTVDVTIREALDRAAGTVESDLATEPQVYADVQAMIGSIYERLGDHARAEYHLRAALETRRVLFGNASCDVAATLNDLSWTVGGRDPYEQEQLLREALDIFRAAYGEPHPVTAVQKSYIAACLTGRGDHAEAESMVRGAIDTLRAMRDGEDGDLAFALKILAYSLHRQGRTAEADAAYGDALDLHRRVYPPDHYELGLMLGSYARFLTETGRADEAAAYRDEAAAISLARVGQTSSCRDPSDSSDDE